jgi:hypothetical protein
MQTTVVGFYQDEDGHWAARLECGHGQHVRHDPPWMVREWVMTEEGRAARSARGAMRRRIDSRILAISKHGGATQNGD